MSKDFKIKKETKNINNNEDVTKYGEFVSSYFAKYGICDCSSPFNIISARSVSRETNSLS